MTDASNIIERAKAGEPEAFQTLIRPHLDSIRRYARTFCKNENDADDLAQDVLVKAFRAFASFDGRASISTWLFTIAKHQFLDYRRGRLFRWRSREERYDDEAPRRQPTPERLVKERERAQLLWDALRKIDEKFRTPLVLAEVEGLSYDDIATIEGVPIGTVRSRIARAKDRLRELLTATSPGDFASDSGTVGVPTSSQPVTEESR